MTPFLVTATIRLKPHLSPVDFLFINNMDNASIRTIHQRQFAGICTLHSYAVGVGAYTRFTIDDCVSAYCQEVSVPCADKVQSQRAIMGLFPTMQAQGGHTSGYHYLQHLHHNGRHLFFRSANAKCECLLADLSKPDLIDRLRADATCIALICLNKPGGAEAHSMAVTFDQAANQLVLSDANQDTVWLGQMDMQEALLGSHCETWTWGHQLLFTPR